MNAQGTPIALRQHLEIAAGLSRLHGAERVFLPRNLEIVGVSGNSKIRGLRFTFNSFSER